MQINKLEKTVQQEAEFIITNPDVHVTAPEMRRVMQGLLDAANRMPPAVTGKAQEDSGVLQRISGQLPSDRGEEYSGMRLQLQGIAERLATGAYSYSNASVNFGAEPFAYPVPAGYKPMQQQAEPQHSDDFAVDDFAKVLKRKLAAQRAKGYTGWQDCPPAELSRRLREHVEKGDPVDVANFCMFLWCLQKGILKLNDSETIDIIMTHVMLKGNSLQQGLMDMAVRLQDKVEVLEKENLSLDNKLAQVAFALKG